MGSMFQYCRNIGHNIRAMATSAPVIRFLDMPNGKKIAYEKVEGSADMPTVMFVPGFMSGKDGDKPRHLRDYCIKKNYTFVRYDPTCIGDSLGDWTSLEFEDWVENAGNVLDNLGSDKNIVIGSSMGGWISLWLGSQEKYKKKITSMMVIAPAVNFLRPFYAEMLKNLPKEAQDTLEKGEVNKWTSMPSFLIILPITSRYSNTKTSTGSNLSRNLLLKIPQSLNWICLDQLKSIVQSRFCMVLAMPPSIIRTLWGSWR